MTGKNYQFFTLYDVEKKVKPLLYNGTGSGDKYLFLYP